MLLGYNTNGLAHHDPFEALELLAELGYQSVALTLDHGPLNPLASDWPQQQDRLRQALRRLGLRSVVETGARFLLNPRHKHEPTLLSARAEDREVRCDFLRRAITAAAYLGSDCVSLWSGVLRDNVGDSAAWQRLVGSLAPLCDYAAEKSVLIGFEPEPGMFVDTMARYAELIERLPSTAIKLTLDIGHLHCLGETPLGEQIERWKDRIVNIHLEDMRTGVHEHLMFGEGEMDFPTILAALATNDYSGGVHVELSRHSHVGPQAAEQSFQYLSPLLQAAKRQDAIRNSE